MGHLQDGLPGSLGSAPHPGSTASPRDSVVLALEALATVGLRTNPLQVRGLVAGPPVGQSPRVLRSLRFHDNCRLEKLWHFSESRLHLDGNRGVLPIGPVGWGPL